MTWWHLHEYPGHPDGVEHRWCGEFWPDEDDTGAPWGVCWVAEYPEPVGPALWYVLVADTYRRRGVATALIRSAREKWPRLRLTEGVTSAGEALYDSLSDGWEGSSDDQNL